MLTALLVAAAAVGCSALTVLACFVLLIKAMPCVPEAEMIARRERRMWPVINRAQHRADLKALREASSEDIFTELDRWHSG